MPLQKKSEKKHRFVHLLSRLKSAPVWITIIYALFAGAWIYFSDHALGLLVEDPAILVELSVYKGLLFVTVTSLLLFLMMHRGFGALQKSNQNLVAHELEVARLTRMYAALSQINQAIVWTPNRDELFQKICRVLVEYGGFQMAWIGWRNSETQRVEPVASFGKGTDYLDNVEIYADDRPEGQGPTGKALREDRPYISNDVLKDPALLTWRKQIQKHGFRASATFPIRLDKITQGVLNVYAQEVDFFQVAEVALIEEAASDVSFALENFIKDEQRRDAETKVVHERDFSDAVINSMPGVLYLYDQNGKFIRWNKNFETVTGYQTPEIANMHPLDFFAGEDKDRVAARINEVFEIGESHVEALFLTKSGIAIPYYFTGKVVTIEGKACLVGVGIDISEKVQAEEALRTSEARYHTLFDYAPDGIVIGDKKSYYLDANPSICRMLGYTREELVGLHASNIIAKSEVAQIEKTLENIHTHAKHNREWRFVRKDGSEFSAEVLATVMPDGNLLGMIRDITQRKEAEKALHELNETLEHKVAERTDQLQAALIRAEAADRIKSAFLATMSHELRTPLNSIIGFTGVVLQELAGPLNAEQIKQLSMVRSSARHLLDLIKDVLDISKIEAGQLEVRAEPFFIVESIANIVASVQLQADKKGLRLTVEHPDDLGDMIGDRRRMEQILLNLLSNAIKFTEQGEVRLTVETFTGFSFSPNAVPQEAIQFRVTDTGIGIQSEDLATLFQPFRQVDTGLARQHEGTGLGLAICRRLATLMGGVISASSQWKVGSEFTVILPRKRNLPT